MIPCLSTFTPCNFTPLERSSLKNQIIEMSSETKTRVLICISPSAAPLDSAEYFDPTSSVSGLSSLHNESGVEVRLDQRYILAGVD